MRALVPLVAAMLLAGCAAPAKEKEDDPLFGVCPQWAQGPGGVSGQVGLEGDGSYHVELGPANATYLGRPLDLFRIVVEELDANGTLELRASASDGSRLTLRDYRLGDTQMVPVVTVDPGLVGHEVDVFLSPVLHDAPAAPQPASLNWTLDGGDASVRYSVTYHYKVCGA